jgi:phosphatidylserine decarboxylase
LFFNRYAKTVEEEEVFHGVAMRLAYATAAGRLTLAPLIRRKIFSVIVGKWASSAASRWRIEPFIERFRLRIDSFEKKVPEFTSFNDFFSRKLKPSARPISPSANAVISPVDGRHLAYASMRNLSPFFIKGEKLSAEDLIVDGEAAGKFTNGNILISRLCPTDYHRFHFPISCVPEKTFLIGGAYSSVHPIAMAGKVGAFLKNKRMYTLLHTETCGDILMIEIGATCVGSLRQTFHSGKPALKGEEKGYFEFGGSTVILVFENGRVTFSPDILENTARGMETYVLMGDEIATFP